jgi:hypothetical protein
MNSTFSATTIGIAFGTFFVGARNILPWNTAWLYGKGDGSAAQLLWRFYEQSPIIQWPITAVPNYVVGANTVNPDGNSIFAVGAKVISLLIPGQFQYFGVLIVLWFALQAFFAERLISRFVENKHLRLLGMAFFILSPAFLYRLGSMRHFHVASHWLILAALHLYFGKSFKRFGWSILLVAAIAINIYIAAIVVSIFLVSAGREILVNRRMPLLPATVVFLVIPLVAAALSFVISGYLSFSSSAVGSGFFRLNLFAFFNPGYSPSGSFSVLANSVLPSTGRSLIAEEWEGFQYIGPGVVLMLPILLILVWRSRRHLLKSHWMPIGVVSTLLFFFALSNRITFFRLEFSYWWPNALLHIHGIFRGAPRFGVALYYLITLATVVSVSKLFSKRTATIIMGLLLIVVIVDQSAGIRQSHKDLSESSPIETLLADAEWSLVVKGHSKLVIDKNFDFQVDGGLPADASIFSDNWYALAMFAVGHHMSTNFGYVARPIQAFVKAEDARVAAELASGDLDSKAIYLISNEKDWTRYKDLVGKNGRALVLDGFFVIVGQ